jgi:hypothetical protein
LELHEGDFVAGALAAIPGAVFGDEGAVAVFFRELLAGVEGEFEGGVMCA